MFNMCIPGDLQPRRDRLELLDDRGRSSLEREREIHVFYVYVHV